MDAVDAQGLHFALELEVAQKLGVELPAEQPQRRLADEDAAGLVQVIRGEVLALEAFEPRAGVYRVPVTVVFHALLGAEAAGRHRPGKDADAHADERQAALLQALVERDQAL